MFEIVSNMERNCSMARPINIQHDEAVSGTYVWFQVVLS